MGYIWGILKFMGKKKISAISSMQNKPHTNLLHELQLIFSVVPSQHIVTLNRRNIL